VIRLIELHDWNFLFLIGAFFAIIALELLVQVKERGEVEKEQVKRIMRTSFRNSMRDYFLIGHLMGLREHLWTAIRKKLHEEDSDKIKS
jgi:hypothetical protein